MNKRTPAAPATASPATPTLTEHLRSLWLGSAARYTVLTLIALLINAMAHDSLTDTYVDTVRFFLLLPFAAFLTLAAWVRRSDKLSGGARVCLHFLLSMGSFYLCVYLPYQVQSKPSGQQVLMLVLLAIILYGIGMAIYLFCTRRRRVAVREAVPYESQFKHRND